MRSSRTSGRFAFVVIAFALVVGASVVGELPRSGDVSAVPPPNAAVSFQPVVPSRVLDTRFGVGAPEGRVGAGGVVELSVAGVGGVPAEGVGAVVLNVTVTEPTEPSFVTVWPTGEERPLASSLNMAPGQTVPNLVVARVGVDGKVSLFNGFGSTHLIADVTGWFPEAADFHGIVPTRVRDTRTDDPAPVAGGEYIDLDFGSTLPDGAVAVALNVTLTGPSAPTFITAWPTGDDRPVASNLNAMPGDTRPNLVVVKLSDDRRVSLFNGFGDSHLVVDLVGWFGVLPVSLSVDPGLEPSEPFIGTPDRPLAAVAGDGITTDFVLDELLVAGPRSIAEAVADEWSGLVVSSQPGGQGLPAQHLVKIDVGAIDPPPFEGSFDQLFAAAAGDFTVSSAGAYRLLALAAHLVAQGVDVAVNPVIAPLGYQDGSLTEDRWNDPSWGVNSDDPFDWPYLREGGAVDHGFTSAWQRLDAVGRLRPSVKVAVVDGGFAESIDQENVTVFGADFGEPNDAECGGKPCPWHGTNVIDTISAIHDNHYGTAGGAAPVIRETLAYDATVTGTLSAFASDLTDIFLGSWGDFETTKLGGVQLINISMSAKINSLLWPLTAPILEPIALTIFATGILIVASAGNSGENVDAEKCAWFVCVETSYVVPCELVGVLCVGGTQHNTRTHAEGSNYGKEHVDLWASFTVHAGHNPDDPNRTAHGTSYSAPLVTAAAALVLAANPDLLGVAAGYALRDSAKNQPGEKRAKKVLDVQAAVTSTLNGEGRDVSIVMPDDDELGWASEMTLDARACCNIADPPEQYTWYEGPAGGSLSLLTTGRTPTIRLTQGAGERRLRVRARWSDGTQRTDEIEYRVVNQDPTAEIVAPTDGTEFYESQTIPLTGLAYDIRGYGPDVPSSFQSWSVHGQQFATGPTAILSGLSVGTHTVSYRVTDGDRSVFDTIEVVVVEDPPNPPPSARIVSPTTGFYGNNTTDPVLGYRTTAVVDATDPENEVLTVELWSILEGVETKLANAKRDSRRETTYRASIFLPWDPLDGDCDLGTNYVLEARVSDGTTTVVDSASISLQTIC